MDMLDISTGQHRRTRINLNGILQKSLLFVENIFFSIIFSLTGWRECVR